MRRSSFPQGTGGRPFAASALRGPAAARGADGGASDDDCLAARLCVLLQRLSLRPSAHSLFGVGDLRGTLGELLHAAPSEFLAANVRSILHNTKPASLDRPAPPATA